jgi:hypothetical protein
VSRARRRDWLRWAVAASPAAGFAIFLVLRSGPIPSGDYWNLFPRFFGESGSTFDSAAWFSPYNGHLYAGGYALFALNVALTRGSNIGLGALALLAAAAQCLLLIRSTARIEGALAVGRAACIAAFCFPPAAAQWWVIGFSGLLWCWANLLAVAAFLVLGAALDASEIEGARRRARLILLLHIALGAAATLFGASALALWPSSLVVILWRGRRRLAVGYAGLVLGLAAAYLLWQGGSPPLAGFWGCALYAAAFLGGLFTSRVEVAAALTLGGLAAAGISLARLWARRERGHRAGIWLALAAFGAGNAMLAALARGSQGIGQAVSSRYTGVAALFWLGVLQLAWMATDGSRRAQAWRKAVAVGGAASIAAMALMGWFYARPLLLRASLQPLAALAAALEANDAELISEVVTPGAGAWFRSLPLLRAHRLVPFSSPVACADPAALGTRLQSDAGAVTRGGGRLERIDLLEGGRARVSGRLGSLQGDACVWITDEERRVRGFAVPTLRDATGQQRFLGYVQVPSADARFTAFVEDASGLRRLRGTPSAVGRPSRLGQDPTFRTLRRAGRWYRRGEVEWLTAE